MITQARLKELLRYNRRTGVFTWRVSVSRRFKPGDTAGNLSPYGYFRIRLDDKLHQAHKLAWLYVTGSWPERFLDHKDLDKSNNKWRNLREATSAQNNRNCGVSRSNSSGTKGVSFHKGSGKWRAYCGVEGNKAKHLGLFDTLREAKAARQAFAKQHHGEFYHA